VMTPSLIVRTVREDRDRDVRGINTC